MSDHYKGYRLPESIIGFAIRYYHCFKLSLRDISELLLDRGSKVTYETIRNWNKIWGPLFAKSLRTRRGTTFTDKWHIDEVRLKIKGEVFWLWRLVDSQGEEIEILLQKRRNAKVTIRFLKKALHQIGCLPLVIITDNPNSGLKVNKSLILFLQYRFE